MQGTKGSARERLLGAASRLFYADGMTATGIDAITAEAGVAKMSLYNNFASKEDLVLAYIDARHEEWLELYRRRSGNATGPLEGVMAVFDAYIDHASAAYLRGFRGCGLLNAAAELPVGSPGREAVRRHKEQVEAILAGHLTGIVSPPVARDTAEHLAFLLEGAMSRAGLEGRPDRLERVRTIARGLVDSL
jgi:AcrR family transcriptional regulator